MSSDQDKQHALPDLTWDVARHMEGQVDYCLWRTRWEGITETASSARQGQPCRLLPYRRCRGDYRMERVVEVEDEVDTRALLRSRSGGRAPVARVFAYQRNDQNAAGAAFMLTEFLPGNSALYEALRHLSVPAVGGIDDDDDDDDDDDVPAQYRQKFRRSLAAAHVRIASVRLPQIGTITRDAGGNLVAGPIPGVGGPFDTAAAYFQALAAVMRHPRSDEDVRRDMNTTRYRDRVEEMVQGQREFPGRLARLAGASGKVFTSEGPFPVYHPGLEYDNIIVDKEFDVLGIVNWEDAMTVPWEMLDAPCSFNAAPRHAILQPDAYDREGEPIDPIYARELANDVEYTAMVREAEQNGNADHRLSDALANRDMRDLAQSIDMFRQGKMGIYGRVMDYLEEKYLGS